MKKLTTLLTTTALGTLTLIGCGGSGGGGSTLLPGFPSGIYALDSSVGDVKSMSDMQGSNWTVYPDAAESAFGFAFDDDGALFVARGLEDRIVAYSGPTDTVGVSFGSTGSGVNQFSFPTAVAFDSQGRIYIGDSENKRIVRMNDMQGTGWTTLDMSALLPGESPVMDIAFDSSDRIYVVDRQERKLFRFDNIADTTPDTFGSSGSGVNQFEFPRDVWIDSQDRIYIADNGNDRIVRINDMTGAGWVTLGTTGAGVGEFDSPSSICTDSQGRIYIAERNNDRVVRINDMTGAGWTAFGSQQLAGAFSSVDDLLVR